jgi:hypothetical protein
MFPNNSHCGVYVHWWRNYYSTTGSRSQLIKNSGDTRSLGTAGLSSKGESGGGTRMLLYRTSCECARMCDLQAAEAASARLLPAATCGVKDSLCNNNFPRLGCPEKLESIIGETTNIPDSFSPPNKPVCWRWGTRKQLEGSFVTSGAHARHYVVDSS